MASTAKLNEAYKQRQALATRIELTKKTIALYDATTDPLILKRAAEEIPSLEKSLSTLHGKIISYLSKQDELEDAEKVVYDLCQELWKMGVAVDKLRPDPIPVITNNTSTPHNIRFPKSELPQFTGKQEDWMSFKDLFIAAVKNASGLADSQRLYYLNQSVKGEAKDLIKNFQITDGNFQQAWDSLEERYENKGELIYTLIKKLINLKCVPTESVSQLRKLVDSMNEGIRALSVLGAPTDHWDDILVVTLVEKLDPDTRRDWAKSRKGSKVMSTYSELSDFLNSYIRALTTAGVSTGGNSRSSNSFKDGEKKPNSHYTSETPRCVHCKEEHLLYKCPEFAALSPRSRVSIVHDNKLCVKCLRPGHYNAVEKCFLKKKCSLCKGDHDNLLHGVQLSRGRATTEKGDSKGKGSNSTTESPVIPPPTETVPVVVQSNSTTRQPECFAVLLSTAVVRVKDNWGNYQMCRVFLDSGSQISLITEACRSRLGLARKRTPVTGIGGIQGVTVGRSKGRVDLQLFSCVSEFGINVVCDVLAKVTNHMPNFTFDKLEWDHIKGITLADPRFHEAREVDILLGGDVCDYIIKEKKIMGPPLTPTARETELGWILSGCVYSSPFTGMVTSHHVSEGVDVVLKRFWELEQVPGCDQLTTEEQQAEDHFVANHRRNEDGRFVVGLPYNENLKNLGSSREIAKRRLFQLERRLPKFPEHHEEYRKFMREYESLGHMSKVPESEMGEHVGKTNFLPHHFVLKEDSTTTKLRVVFDGSCKTSTGISLNDCLLVGPTIQDDIFALLLRFRMNPIALKADVVKMFRQFVVPKYDQDRQRILWRESPDQPISEFRLNTVTYGTASGPFSSTRCLKQLAVDHAVEFPTGSRVAIRDMYVDDLIGGAKTKEEAVRLIDELCQLMGRGCLEIRKWESNDKEVLSHLPEHLRASAGSTPMDKEVTGKALGVAWDSGKDYLCFSGYSPRNIPNPTRRTVLSEMARVFDPLGFLSPFTARLKIFFQELWKPIELEVAESRVLTWDDPLPETYVGSWNEFLEGMHEIKNVSLKRCVLDSGVQSYELHGFSDASEKAYSAVIFVRCVQEDGKITSLMFGAKNKVAPTRHVSIPRLELCGALLLSRLVKAVTRATEMTCPIYAWTDSEIVLRWLSSSSRRWSTFVAHRVAKIQDTLPSESWRYVPTKDNPADCASRGLSAKELMGFDLWWHGPEWLRFPQLPGFQTEKKTFGPELEEKRKIPLGNLVLVENVEFGLSLVKRYSKVNLLKRVVACLLRFIRNCRKPREERATGFLKVTELQEAWVRCIKWSQMDSFPEELKRLNGQRPVRVDSKIVSLDPYMDESGILRVGGRIQNSQANEDLKHQIILSGDHVFTRNLIRHIHLVNFHAGVKLLTGTLIRTYHVVGARQAIKTTTRSCVECRRQRGVSMKQQMGNFPMARVRPSDAFTHSGLDFSGHFTIQPVKGRDLGDNGVEWSFNPPGAPHQGGLWEAAVKSTKYHLKRVVGDTILSLEEFGTILCQVEAILNSRPLCPLSTDPGDLDVLTPGHFLIGRPLTSMPEPSLMEVKINRLSRWERAKQITQHFWKRWNKEYLTTLQQRAVWTRKSANAKEGDLVLIKDDNLPPMKWNRGRIIKIHPGADGLVRVVTLKTANGQLQRPVVKVVPLLEVDD